MEVECKDEDFQVVTDEPVPDFAELAATALDNAGIDPAERLRLANNAAADRQEARLPDIVESDADEVVYEITFDFPDAGLGNNVVPPDPLLQAWLAMLGFVSVSSTTQTTDIFVLTPTCCKCRPDTLATFCYVGQYFGCQCRVGEFCRQHNFLHVGKNQY